MAPLTGDCRLFQLFPCPSRVTWRGVLVLGSLLTLTLLSWIRYDEEEPIFELQEIWNVSAVRPVPLRLRSATLRDRESFFFLDLEELSREYPALQSYECRTFIPRHCRTLEPLIVLAIKSHPASSERRTLLRYTWAQERRVGDYRLLPVFLIANSGRREQMELLLQEASFFQDIVLWDFLESHQNLSLKERCFLEWVSHACPEADYIFKGDDDEFVNTHALVRYVSTSLKSHPRHVHGFFQNHAPVEREGKYGVPFSVFPYDIYPPFVSGGGFLFAADLVPSLLKASSIVPVFPLDDIYFGFLALAANVPLYHDERFYSFGLKSAEPCVYRDAVVVHGLSRYHVLQMWNLLPHVPPCPPNTERRTVTQ
ncbi:N-acetyllactosaminide beta-1,3-N-acetylglucosaminyltransferase 3-like [Rhinoderma darwinii]|uniref:N-acetyllactosaminide beta-1,3-N-acetylglucosaminyltransferase 3-like n=1 Tax=Rhinoderma darwinii TaxID=43563 RepID=UPI003F680126